MSPALRASLPFLVLSAAIVVVMLLIAVRRDHRMIATVTAIGLLASLAAIIAAAPAAPVAVTPMFLVDGFTLFFLALVLVASVAVVLLSHAYLDGTHDGPYDEYYLLLLLATLGAGALLASVQFASFFLALETLSIALIGLIAYPRGRAGAIEAGIKYLLLAGVSSAFLLFGIALIYLDFGTMSFAALGRLWSAAHGPTDIYAYTGFAMLLTGIGFKLSLVPFHMWAPDIYEGAPAPVTGYVAVVSKIGVFALLLRYFVLMDGYHDPSLLRVIALVAILSMLIGNLLALLQDNVKRILAYSSIAHLGYVLVALLAGGVIGIEAASYYLAAYAVTTIGAFGVVAVLSQQGSLHDTDRLDAYRGLMWTRPWLASAFTAFLLSLAGIPPTMGFIAKVYVMTSGVGTLLIWPLAALVIGSVIGLYYYLRIIVVLFSPVRDAEPLPPKAGVSWAGGLTLAVLVVLLIGLGVYPTPVIALAHETTAGLMPHQKTIHTAEILPTR
ncbi:NADH-quinone oxidoreductase subunit N [Acidiphilium sp. AL]|uniref:NADH-quinone oxidoreductase subunit N n=1 Tax=Acidiphilium iwatense TaxID=768198 RepID=A0ABS9DWP7_9PROT|nr:MULTISPECIES: NADH-quinone oxidoreductase subunit N [Acidiphilium]MCF3947152.1 NADH-quinone oxidoreductase subunit N [Acidiphilium iwatense]MCU4160635.1 NADH-quinone oxidoreductase subunit N [Acidiphilium sp. AL]